MPVLAQMWIAMCRGRAFGGWRMYAEDEDYSDEYACAPLLGRPGVVQCAVLALLAGGLWAGWAGVRWGWGGNKMLADIAARGERSPR